MHLEWKSYGGGRDTGVRDYALLPDAIALRFSDGSVYLYDADRPGSRHVQQMRRLAEQNAGLTTYVSLHVRELYAGKLTADELRG